MNKEHREGGREGGRNGGREGGREAGREEKEWREERGMEGRKRNGERREE